MCGSMLDPLMENSEAVLTTPVSKIGQFDGCNDGDIDLSWYEPGLPTVQHLAALEDSSPGFLLNPHVEQQEGALVAPGQSQLLNPSDAFVLDSQIAQPDTVLGGNNLVQADSSLNIDAEVFITNSENNKKF